jgi:hypothetical protein
MGQIRVENATSRFARTVQPGWALGAIVFLFATALFAGSADAAVIHKPAGTFNIFEGPGSPPPAEIGIDEQGGFVYVVGRYNSELEKFDLAGNPSPFSGIEGPNEHQGVHMEDAWSTGDAFKLTCPNGGSTLPIEWDKEDSGAMREHIKAAIELKCGGTITVVGDDPRHSDIEFGGTLGHTDLPQISCSTVSGPGTCFTTGGGLSNGSTSTNKIRVACNCGQIAVDNSGGPNQGVIYIASNENLTTGPQNKPVPKPSGGIHAYLPSGVRTHSQYQGVPINAYEEYELGYTDPVGLGGGGLFTRSQTDFDKRACGVAVDEDGNLIIAHDGENQEFSYFDKLGILPWASNDQQEGTLLGTLNADVPSPCRLQLDSAGNLYYQTNSGDLMFGEGSINKYESPAFHEPSGTGAIPAELTDPSKPFHEGPDRSFALDGEDHVYVVRAGGPPRIQQLDQLGSLTETFGAGELVEPADVAVNKATGEVFVSDGAFDEGVADIRIYKALTVPNSITKPFSRTTRTSGELLGEVDLAEAGEKVTDCEFEYTTESLFVAQEFEGGTDVPCDEGTAFTANASVSTEVTGLTLEEPYVYRLVTENGNGVSNGTVRRFRVHSVQDLATKAATDVAPRSATLNASFTGDGDATEYFFEYGDGPAGVYTQSTSALDAGSPSGPTQISASLPGLELETTYHFRVVAKNGSGESQGFDQSFKTPPAVAALKTEPATAIGQDTVTLNAKFTGDGHGTTYYFEYGPTSSYGQVSGDPLDAGTTTGPTSVSAEISNYFAYRTYHYRVVAENGFGTTYGKDRTFTTAEAPEPTVSDARVEEVTPTTATLSAVITPKRGAASWLFEWGHTTVYGSYTESEPVLNAATNESFPIEVTITGLEPGSLYHFRAVAFNFSGVTRGEDLTFKTPSAPAIVATSSSGVTETGATLSARVQSEAGAEIHFEFGMTASYGSTVPGSAAGGDAFAPTWSATLTGLAPGTTYHYRAVATNQIGTTTGPDGTFTTAPAAARPPGTPPAQKKCPKGKVKRHGKCVPKHKRHKHKKKKVHK